MTLSLFQTEFRALRDSQNAIAKTRYFKSGPGEYGEGDQFLGMSVPVVRSMVKKFVKLLTLEQCEIILQSCFHEERLFALLAMVFKYKKGNREDKESIFECYLKNRNRINNWDLVDSSASQIVGGHLLENPSNLLEELAVSESLWDRRIATIATFAHIEAEQFEIPLKIADILRDDSHDLIHKAVGWMIREIGNKSLKTERLYLLKNYKQMPRTMLRYAIEKFPNDERKMWLKGEM